MYVVGTAGHVDHGKSTLVKALTGIDPDRLEEEQRREMTIDLGFAWLTLPGGQVVSMIDVPGHERFIKNMLAGVGGIDAALLVIAADESVMPQTEEHLAILDLLEVRHGVVALTKADLVDEEWLALVRDDVRARLAETTLAGAPLVAVSARSGRGLAELVETLGAVLRQAPSRASGRGAARMPVDRSFTIGGFGAVVTGTLLGGPLAVGDELEVLPRGQRVRVRGLQVHQQRAEQALPGSRAAVNLAGISHHDIARGDVLARPGAIRPTDMIDARLRLTAAARPVRQNDRLELFVGAAEAPGRVTLLDSDEIGPGEAGWVQIRLERPVAVARGDRYILRQPSPSQTLGGGTIVDAHPARHRRFRTEVIAALEALARGTPADLVRQALADGAPRSRAELARTTGLGEELVAEGAEELAVAGELVELESGGRPWAVTREGWHAAVEKARAALAGYHRRYPLRGGLPREELRSRMRLGAEALEVLLGRMEREGLAVVQEASVRAPEHRPHATPEQEREVRRMLDSFAKARYSPPAPELDAELLAFLIEQGQIVRVAPDVAFLPEAYDEMVGWVRTAAAADGGVTVAGFRDRFSTSRKYALALLEHLDERRVTRRVGDARVLY